MLLAKRLLRDTVIRTGYELWHRHQRPLGIRVLMYHRVNDQHPEDDLTVSRRNFAAQMEALALSGYCVVTLEAASRWLAGAGALPMPAVVLTFDDGYADTYCGAFPVLGLHKFPATVFVASGLIGTDRRLPRYAGGGDGDRMMSWSELRELAASELMEIGAHTMNHRELPGLGIEEAREEIVSSKRMLEEQLRRPVGSFAYPRGVVNGEVRRLVDEAGFDAACTVRGGLNRVGVDRLMLYRTGISGHDTVRDFLMKLTGAFDWIHGLMSFT